MNELFLAVNSEKYSFSLGEIVSVGQSMAAPFIPDSDTIFESITWYSLIM